MMNKIRTARCVLVVWLTIMPLAACSSSETTDATGGTDAATDAQDASGDGIYGCEEIFPGWSWNGTKCAMPEGCGTKAGTDVATGTARTTDECACVGEGCDQIYQELVECWIAWADCLGLQLCDGPEGTACADNQYCEHEMDMADGYMSGCGAEGSLGVCQDAPDDCSDAEPTPCCGCDGKFYETYCEAHRAGVEINTGASADSDDSDCP